MALALVCALALPLGGCKREPCPKCRTVPAIKGKVPKDVVATVNGKMITKAEVTQRAKRRRRGKHGKRGPKPSRDALLKSIINREVMAQKAVALGLTKDPRYQRELARLRALFAVFNRSALVSLYERHMLSKKVKLSAAELEAHYNKNAQRIRTELHVFQIFTRHEAKAKKALAELAKGKDFVAVSKSLFTTIPKGSKPWDLGYLKWKFLPKPWLAVVYKLKKGERTGIIRGTKRRFWILKLVDKRENKALTFDAVKAHLRQKLEYERVRKQRAAAFLELRKKARVVLR